MITLDLSQAVAGCERIQRRLAAIEHVMDHAGDLMEHWERLVEEGNRRGVLVDQTDKDGGSLLAVTYRPTAAQKRAIYAGTAKPQKLTASQRLGQNPRLPRGAFYGIGDHQSGTNNNLTSSEYRRLTGPPLAPRGQFSRVITNFETSSFQIEEHGSWLVVGGWREVVSRTGYHFLPHLFDGDPPQPGSRDLRGVRPKDIEKIRATILPWAKLIVRALWQGTD
ncbi:MAG TPA: hypothetical protein VKF17_16870 [Isosphaeraceae bacterium]|nr:hypothetical protein [Isosphaeraceae bacterium]